MSSPITHLYERYQQLLNAQSFRESDLDYSILDRHLAFLNRLDSVGNSSISVFDLYRKNHQYVSRTFQRTLGFSSDNAPLDNDDFINSRIHPDDFPHLLENGIRMMQFVLQLPVENRRDYKSVTDYRLRNAQEEYVRVVEQQQVLELDPQGNFWLALSIMDLSPDQDTESGIKSRIVNFKTGEIVDIGGTERSNKEEIRLSQREIEILSLVKAGHLSKEIASRLFISVHTVNTHRQRILEKLNAGNSMEAVRYAMGLGLLN